MAGYLEPSHAARVRARLDNREPREVEPIDGYMPSNVGAELLAWWMSARGDKDMPAADDVRMETLVELAPYLRYLGWDGPERLIVRLFGTALSAGMGQDMTGQDLFGFGDYPDRGSDIARLKLLHSHPCGVVLFWEMADTAGGEHQMELLTLPVGAGADGGNRLIGTVMPVHQEARWESVLTYAEVPKLREAQFIDLGFGVPSA
ncbi:MAG: hypothetical protein COA62_13280 [Rhodobiaceae bacterium]|nr:MAG: hypothetical protein COA62_13280 [Rhodobiaceae bacterium]